MSWSNALELEEKGIPFVCVTILSTKGHAPQDPGAKALVTLEGLVDGTVGGGKVEARSIHYAQELLKEAEAKKVLPQVVTWNLQRDIGMTCGGEVTYLFEVHHKALWSLAIFGAGHVSQALTRILLPLNCKLSVLDTRQEWIDKLPQAPNLQTICVAKMSDEVKNFSINTSFILMTQGHAVDVPILEEILKTHPAAPYIGVIGSEVKALKIRNEFAEKGFSKELLSRLNCPMGIPLGTNHPQEIAISIAGELIQNRDRLHSVLATRA